MNAALIGLGYWGKVVLPILVGMEKQQEFKLEHVCDHNEENILKYKNIYPNMNFHLESDELLKLDKLDMVFITTGLHTHYELAKLFLTKGCHTFIEKPFVLTVNEANKLNKLAQSKSLTLMVGHRLLYSPSFQYVKNYFNCKINNGAKIEASWLQWGIHQSNGVHWDLACHYLAMFYNLIGRTPMVSRVMPVATSASGNVEKIKISLDYKGRINATISASWNNPYKKKEIIITFSDSIIFMCFDNEFPLTIYQIVNNKNNKRGEYDKSLVIKEKFDNNVMNEMTTIENEFIDFISCARSGDSVIASTEIATDVVKTLCSIDNLL